MSEDNPGEKAAMMRQLREFSDRQAATTASRVDILCERFGMVQHPTMRFAVALIDYMVDEYFPWGERTEPITKESDMASAFALASILVRRCSFAHVPDEVWHELSGTLDGYPQEGVDPKTGKKIMVMPDREYDDEGSAIPKLDDGTVPRSWYRWVAVKLDLPLRSDWPQIDHDVRAIARWWGETDNDHALAHRLYVIAETIRWGYRGLERDGIDVEPPPPPITDGQHRKL